MSGYRGNFVISIGFAMASLSVGQANAQAIDTKPAIERGIAFLRENQGPGGDWSYQFSHDHRLGMTALAGLTLLECGVSLDDASIQRALQYVREQSEQSNQTYDLTLALLFLSRIPNDDSDRLKKQLLSLASQLEAGQNDGGDWSYFVPRSDELDASLNVDDLDARQPRPRVSNFFSAGQGDNSNTQFALLGLWSASRQGFAANRSLESVDRHFRATFHDRGGWGYRSGMIPSPAMTCAGVIGLAVGASRPELAERYSSRARGQKLASDPIFQQALETLARDARAIDHNTDTYYLWSLERACVALGLERLNGFDWYAAGASELLRRQRNDGGWPDGRWGRLPETCLALLFLRKSNLAAELDRALRLPIAEDSAAPGPGPSKSHTLVPTNFIQETADPSVKPGQGGVSVTVRQVDESQFPTITLDFEVKGPGDQPILDATREEFRITEYDQPVEILEFQAPTSREIRPTTVVLVVDRSRSMEEEDRIGGLKQSVAEFLEHIPAGSRIAVIAFGSDVRVICPFTNDVREVQEAVNRLEPAGGTRYYDAVLQALELLQDEPGRKAILALTDGEDTFSRLADLDTTILEARRAGFPVHTLGLGSEDEIASDDLRALASATRGQYFSARDSAQLGAIYEEIATRLGQAYTLSYRSDRPLPDGTLRPVRIYYQQGTEAVGQAEVFIRGMVVPASGWSRLFLALFGLLAALALAPRIFQRIATS